MGNKIKFKKLRKQNVCTFFFNFVEILEILLKSSMESLLEQQRCYHEEMERMMDALVGEKMASKKTHKDTLNSDHRQRAMVDRYMTCSGLLKEIYEDKDGQRREEVAKLSGPNEFAEFYERLKQIKEFHRRHPGEAISVPMSVEFDELKKAREGNDDTIMAEFTDEEGYGRFLDLHECYEKYVNLKGVEKTDYVTYLTVFDRLFDIPKDKKGSEFRAYLGMLLDYLYDFTKRVQPLLDINTELEDVRTEFEPKFNSGEFQGWPKEIASLGLDRLKSALMALGLKCGGTLEERASRLFSTKGKGLNELDPALFAKSKGKASTAHRSAKELEKNREIAAMEAQVYRFAEILSEQRAATKENVERKQARTELEREDSDEDESEEEPEADDDDDDIPYNPKNLPLGWDGKPIPYWLYKLHGLNISYNCEICGNYTYKGPKAFQRHFAEWRHAHGMRCLGIPNTAHFANVTQIEDAMALWEKLKNQKSEEAFKPEQEEEFEDSQGNVVNKKIYEDLKRQGLL